MPQNNLVMEYLMNRIAHEVKRPLDKVCKVLIEGSSSCLPIYRLWSSGLETDLPTDYDNISFFGRLSSRGEISDVQKTRYYRIKPCLVIRIKNQVREFESRCIRSFFEAYFDPVVNLQL